MSKDNVTGKDKDFYELGKRMFDRLKPLLPIKPVVEPRPWVGLTDTELKEIIGGWGDAPITRYTRNFTDRLEAKLKEKNRG